jgi:hypothetical protein
MEQFHKMPQDQKMFMINKHKYTRQKREIRYKSEDQLDVQAELQKQKDIAAFTKGVELVP